MHFGEVLYGNIGSKTRIDFTVVVVPERVRDRLRVQLYTVFGVHLQKTSTRIRRESGWG